MIQNNCNFEIYFYTMVEKKLTKTPLTLLLIKIFKHSLRKSSL